MTEQDRQRNPRVVTATTRAACVASLLVGALASGCTLIDQRTFDASAGQPPLAPKLAPPAPPSAAPPALVVIGPDETGYAVPLARAVAQARARKPDVVFDVVEIQPPDAAASAQLGAKAADVARAIAQAGVPEARIRLVARPDPLARAGEVRVFVR